MVRQQHHRCCAVSGDAALQEAMYADAVTTEGVADVADDARRVFGFEPYVKAAFGVVNAAQRRFA